MGQGWALTLIPHPSPNPGREAVLGARHQKTVRTMCSLAECLHEQVRVRVRIRVRVRVTVRVRVPNPNPNPNPNQGRLAAAVSEMCKAAQTAREALGPDEP